MCEAIDCVNVCAGLLASCECERVFDGIAIGSMACRCECDAGILPIASLLLFDTIHLHALVVVCVTTVFANVLSEYSATILMLMIHRTAYVRCLLKDACAIGLWLRMLFCDD